MAEQRFMESLPSLDGKVAIITGYAYSLILYPILSRQEYILPLS